MQRILNLVRQVAPTSVTVLIRGETGTGKEVIAKAIHQLSPRRDKPFVTVNCAALPETLIESELFGYEKGAFTGASGKRLGRFQQAHTGTLLLDEIAEMQPHLQVKLLRIIQEGLVEPLGSHQPVLVDVRLIAATNRDLEQAVRDGLFREELYYRLNVVQLELPPLRERPEDIPLLVHHFIRRFAERNQRDIRGIENAAMRALQAHPWPGNVRQMEHVIERAVILASENVITLRDLPPDIAGKEVELCDGLYIPFGTSLEDIKSLAIRETLKRTDGNKELAAKLLDISSRTIHRWIADNGETTSESEDTAAE
jgi:two-component system response regulator HydG